MTTTDTRPDIPPGYTRDTNGRELTYKDNNGYWYEYTRDTNGKVLTFKDSDDDWCEYTYDTNGKVLTYKDSDDYWCERTYDPNGNILTHKNNDYWWERTYDANGKVLAFKSSDSVEWVAIAHADNYTLGYDTTTHKYHAGCRVFTRAEALAHWGTPRDDNAARAAMFVAAINNHKE